MRVFFILLQKELRSFFMSPIAYIVIALVMLLNGFAFRAAVRALATQPTEGMTLVRLTFDSALFWYSYFFIFPLITMRLFAEEQKMGTMESLLTAPVRTSQVVLSKYAAALVFYCILWVPSVLNFFLFGWVTGEVMLVPEGPLWGSYLILFFMGAFNVAVGCFASSLTSNQIVAAVVAFTFSVLHFLVGFVLFSLRSRLTAEMGEITSYIASAQHLKLFTSGLLDTRPLIYYATFSFVFLFMTHKVLEFRRWRV